MFTDTFLALNHDIYCGGNNLIITVYWNPLASYVWLETNATNPATGATALTTTGSQIQTPFMYVALGQNPDINRSLVEKSTSPSGFKLTVPYVYMWQQSIAAGGNNITAQYTSGLGQRLKRIWWSIYPQSPATPNLSYDKNNLAGSTKITQFQTFINSIPVQQQSFVPQVGDDFLYQKDKLKSTAIQSYNEHLYNFVWCEDFTAESCFKLYKELFSEVPKDNFIDGFPLTLTTLMNYNIQSTFSANLNNYLFSVCERELHIAGPVVMLQ